MIRVSIVVDLVICIVPWSSQLKEFSARDERTFSEPRFPCTNGVQLSECGNEEHAEVGVE